MLCIDGTFLTGKYKGTILTAIGVDCNNQIIPITFAFVESENTESWYWFLERVKWHVVVERPGVCLISDRHSGLLAAIEGMQKAAIEALPYGLMSEIGGAYDIWVQTSMNDSRTRT